MAPPEGDKRNASIQAPALPATVMASAAMAAWLMERNC
jgi:hypothetical protein